MEDSKSPVRDFLNKLCIDTFNDTFAKNEALEKAGYHPLMVLEWADDTFDWNGVQRVQHWCRDQYGDQFASCGLTFWFNDLRAVEITELRFRNNLDFDWFKNRNYPYVMEIGPSHDNFVRFRYDLLQVFEISLGRDCRRLDWVGFRNEDEAVRGRLMQDGLFVKIKDYFPDWCPQPPEVSR